MPLALPHAQKIFGIQKVCESTIIDRPGIVRQQATSLSATTMYSCMGLSLSSVYFPSYFR